MSDMSGRFHGQPGGGQLRNMSPPTIEVTNNGKDLDGRSPDLVTSTANAETIVQQTASMSAASRSPSISPVPSTATSGVDSRFPPSRMTSQYGSKVTLEDEQSSLHRPANGGHMNGSASNLLASPMSCPPHINSSSAAWSAPNSTSNTPTAVPTVIHTSIGAEGKGPAPYFPAMPTSGSSSKSSGGVAGKAVHVAAKKKHQVKASTSSTSLHSADGGEVVSVTSAGSADITARRQKRLERNRESARLSRRRRKHYLEVLEEKVNQLSLDVDRGRREHARQAVTKISQLRSQVLLHVETVALPASGKSDMMVDDDASIEQERQKAIDLLDGPLSRTSHELLTSFTFWTQQLKSFSLSPHAKATLWLTLQGDAFYRGGRSASERLSAARIGERMLNNGNDKVPPISSMWPLVCNEVGLSYEQEERVRTYQRSIVLPDENTWLHRHTARASKLSMQSAHDGMGSVTSALSKREKSLATVLTPEQRLKFLSWAARNSERIKGRFEEQRHEIARGTYEIHVSSNRGPTDTVVTKESGDSIVHKQHLAANLYRLNHRLQTNVLQKFPYRGLEIADAALKKLSRRASFESLGQQKDAEGRLLKRDDSFASSGSVGIMNSASTLSLAGMEDQCTSQQTAQLTPEEAEEAAKPTVDQVLGPVKNLIPPISPPEPPKFGVSSRLLTQAVPETVNSSSQVIDHYDHGHGDVLDPAQYPAPTPILSMSCNNSHQVAQNPLPPSAALNLQQVQYVPTEASTTQIPNQVVAQPTQITYAHQYHQPQPGTHYSQQPQTQTQVIYTTQPMVQPAQMVVVAAPAVTSAPTVAAPAVASAPTVSAPSNARSASSNHVRKSSFLPPHLNAVPEDMFPTGDASEDDFFVGLMEDDWAIGMDLSTD